MKPELIMPFIESLRNAFQTMLHLTVEHGKPFVKQEETPTHDVSGIISLTGDMEGSVVLSFPLDTAKRVVGIFAGVECDPAGADFSDAVGELVNMVSGGAKAKIPDSKIAISCPTVITGSGHVVRGNRDFTCVVIPFTCDCGEFCVEVSVRNSSAVMQRAAVAAA